MIQKVNILFLLISLTALASCSDVFEQDIKDEKITIIAPADNVQSSSTSQIFWWDPVTDALTYNLQIVSPDFNAITTLALDTIISATKFTYTLSPGTYQWRIRAENGSSKTEYITRNLIIDQTSPASVTLSSPASGSTYDRPVTLTWNASSSGDISKYTLYVYSVSLSDTILLSTYPKDITSGTSFPFSDGTTGEDMVWQVKAVDFAGNESVFSSFRDFKVGL